SGSPLAGAPADREKKLQNDPNPLWDGCLVRPTEPSQYTSRHFRDIPNCGSHPKRDCRSAGPNQNNKAKPDSMQALPTDPTSEIRNPTGPQKQNLQSKANPISGHLCCRKPPATEIRNPYNPMGVSVSSATVLFQKPSIS